jgi:hypothetical protein
VTVAGSVASRIRELLEATNPDGTPNLPLRNKGAELAYKHPDYLEAAEEESGKDLLPYGVVLRYPVPPEALEDKQPRPFEEQEGTRAE